MVKSRENLPAAYAFLTGIVLAVFLGAATRYSENATLTNSFYITLVILGLVIGSLHTTNKDTITFLLASVSLVVVGGLGNNTLIFISELSPILSLLKDILGNLLVLFVPATIVVALKTVFSLSNI
jgi:peptidase E